MRDRIGTFLVSGLRGRDWAAPVVLAATLFLLLASVARSFSGLPLSSADEPAHVDYALRVWHGQLPQLLDGVRFRPGFGSTPPVQWVAQHPPLFYLLLAPVVGPLVDTGHPLQAVLAARLVDAVIVALVVPAAAWAAARCFPGAGRLPATVAVVAASTPLLVVQGGVVYNDALSALVGVLGCGVAGAALRSGVTTRLLVGGSLVAAAGMTTRLSFALWFVAIVVAFVFARSIRVPRLRGVWGRVLVALGPVVAGAAASGWFYVRNEILTGSFSGRPKPWPGSTPRPKIPESVVVRTKGFWQQLGAVYRGALDVNGALPWVLLLVPVVLALVGLVVVAVVVLRRRSAAVGRVPDGERWPRALVVAMFVAVLLLYVVVEIRYVAGGGAPNSRYTLGVLMPVLLVVAAGLRCVERAAIVLVPAWSLTAAVAIWSLFDGSGNALVAHSGTVVVGASVAAGVLGVVTLVLFVVGELRTVWSRGGTDTAGVDDADETQRIAARSTAR